MQILSLLIRQQIRELIKKKRFGSREGIHCLLRAQGMIGYRMDEMRYPVATTHTQYLNRLCPSLTNISVEVVYLRRKHLIVVIPHYCHGSGKFLYLRRTRQPNGYHFDGAVGPGNGDRSPAKRQQITKEI